MKARPVLFAAFTGVVALIVAACGGAESTATPKPATTSVPPTAVAATATPRAATPVATPTARPATATPSGPAPKTGGTLNVRWYRDFRSWDTWEASGGYSTGFTKSLMSNLIAYRQDSGTVMEPDLAQSWDVSGDGKTFVFHLNKGVLWHDGTPFTSKDILYNFQRGSNPKFIFNQPRVAPIQSMETPDDATFKVTIKDSSNFFLAGVATPFMLMYPAHKPDMAAWHKSPVGSGPFKFVSDKLEVAYEFTKNPTYFKKDEQGRTLPYLDAITFQVIPDNTIALSAFRSGRIQCGCIFDQFFINQARDQLKRDIPGIKISQSTGPVMELTFNVKKAPFNNPAFRQAVSIGLDKASITAAYEAGLHYAPAPPLLPPELKGGWGLPKDQLEKIPGYNPNHAADLALAKQKLKDSGIDPGTKLELLLSGETYRPVGELAASVLTTDMGLPTTLTIGASVVESNQRKAQGNFQIYLQTEGKTIDDPSDKYLEFITTGPAQNYGGYSNAKFDDLLKAQDRELDPAKRKDMLWEAQRIHLSEFPTVSILWTIALKATWPEVNGYKAGPFSVQNFDFAKVWLDKK